MTYGTQSLILEIHLSAFLTADDITSYTHSATWTCGCFLTYLMSTLWTFYYCHCFILLFCCFVILLFCYFVIWLFCYLVDYLFVILVHPNKSLNHKTTKPLNNKTSITTLHSILLSTTETKFPEAMLSHKARFIDIAFDTIYMPFTSILPHRDVTSVGKNWLPLRVLRNH